MIPWLTIKIICYLLYVLNYVHSNLLTNQIIYRCERIRLYYSGNGNDNVTQEIGKLDFEQCYYGNTIGLSHSRINPNLIKRLVNLLYNIPVQRLHMFVRRYLFFAHRILRQMNSLIFIAICINHICIININIF